MKLSELREFIKDEGVTDIVFELDGVLYDIQSLHLEPCCLTGRRGRAKTLVLQADRFDEIDGTGIRGDDFV